MIDPWLFLSLVFAISPAPSLARYVAARRRPKRAIGYGKIRVDA